MRARARVPSVLVPAVPAASAGRHAQAGDSGEDAEFGFSQPFPVGPAVEGEFDFSLLIQVDIGRAAVIAEYLRESGYPRCTAKRGDRGTGETRAGAEQRRALRGRSAEEGRVAAMSLAALRRRPPTDSRTPGTRPPAPAGPHRAGRTDDQAALEPGGWRCLDNRRPAPGSVGPGPAE